MPNYYPNRPGQQPMAYDQYGNPMYDQYGNPIVRTTNTNNSMMPDWWPRPQSPANQNQQQSQQLSGLPGKWVGAEKDIVPMDVPQDGSIAIFPQQDLTVIFLKKWEGNGTITTVPYIPNVQTQSGPTPEQEFQASVQQRLTKLEQMLINLTKMWQPNEDKEESSK